MGQCQSTNNQVIPSSKADTLSSGPPKAHPEDDACKMQHGNNNNTEQDNNSNLKTSSTAESQGSDGNQINCTSNPTVKYSKKTLKMLESNQAERKKKFCERSPGYASGASSDFSSLGDEGSEFTDDDNSTKQNSDMHKVASADRLNLSSMKSELAAGDTLTNLAVRIETPFGAPIEEFYDGVHDGPILGSGVSGVVRLVTHRATQVKYAVKCLDIGLITTEAGLRQLRNEIAIMCQLDHPNIVALEEVYESTQEIFLVQELCVGGDLFDRLDEQSDYHYSEAQCARLAKQMLSSVRYLHSKSIIHRDLKLENFLFTSTSPDSELKMIDFGLSKHFDNGEVLHDRVGTPYTVAPEIIRGSYDEKCDVWAMGVITYLLLSGETPFGGIDGESLISVKDNILRGSFLFEPKEIWANVSDLGKNFVKRLLNPIQKDRPTAREAQRDEWLQVYAKKDVREVAKLNTNTISSLVRFKEYSDMQKLLYEVLSFTLLPEQISELRSEFEKMDTNGDGEISLTSLKQVLMNNAVAGSLGALTEEEVEDIFNALRVRKSDPSIRWHEFIAAGLSQCKVDDRNLKLAFDRLDIDRKGYIEFDDMMYLVPSSGNETESFRKMWLESVEECKGRLGRITYEDFLLLMKGQDNTIQNLRKSFIGKRDSLITGAASPSLKPVQEKNSESSPTNTDEAPTSVFDDVDESEITVDFNEDEDGQKNSKLKHVVELTYSFDTPSKQGRARSVGSAEHCCDAGSWAGSLPDDDSARSLVMQRRNSKRALILPAHVGDHDVENIIKDDSQSPLVVNRVLYRKHRELRMSVFEASKKFDLKRQAHAAAVNIANSDNDKLSLPATTVGNEKPPLGPVPPMMGAGLIMRRGRDTPADLEELHQKAVFEAAAKRSGRPGRRNRKKTCSDMTGMLNAL